MILSSQTTGRTAAYQRERATSETTSLTHSLSLPLYSLSHLSSNKIVNKVGEIEEGKTEAEKRAERQKAAELEAEKKKKALEEEEKKKKEKAEQGKGKKKKQDD